MDQKKQQCTLDNRCSLELMDDTGGGKPQFSHTKPQKSHWKFSENDINKHKIIIGKTSNRAYEKEA